MEIMEKGPAEETLEWLQKYDKQCGEVDTINAVMKYQGYTDPQQVYDANLPIVFGTLNTMTKEAKEIEKMNQKLKRNH